MQDVVQAPWSITADKVQHVVHRLVEVAQPRKIVLFGSYVQGQSHPDSDLDVLVVAPDSVTSPRREAVRLRRALRGIGICLDILVVRESDFNRLQDQIGLIYREAVQQGRTVFDADPAA